MPPQQHTKPENVLKVRYTTLSAISAPNSPRVLSRSGVVANADVLQRATELIGVDQNLAALTILQEHVTSKRSRNSSITSLEPVMLLFVKLCVDLKKGKIAKDGLYQYKNTAQNTNVGTIEVRC